MLVYNHVKVPILGTQDDSFLCPPDIFFRAAAKMDSDPLFEPPPFACPCVDGLLIIYTLRHTLEDGSVDIAGAWIVISIDQLEINEAMSSRWRAAPKPSDTWTLLKRMGFLSPNAYSVN
jgi:hypothetical protein